MNILKILHPKELTLAAYKTNTFCNEKFFYFKLKDKFVITKNEVVIKLLDNEYMISLMSESKKIIVPSSLPFGRRTLLEYNTEIQNINQGEIYLRIDEKTKKLKMIVVKIIFKG
jgi:hypothetical protein